MQFSEYPYQRPNMETLLQTFAECIGEFRACTSAPAQYAIVCKINTLRMEFETAQELAEIRHSIDTTDSFYEAEQEFFDSNGPAYKEWVNRWYDELLASPLRAELSELCGRQLFTIAGVSRSTFSPQIISELQKENHLQSEYVKLVSSARIDFEGEQRNVSGMYPFEISADREVRRRAAEAKWSFYAGIAEKTERIYEEMVITRHTIARKLGRENFVDVGYNRLLRSGYDAAMVANFRKQVQEHIVPMASRLYQRQAKRLGLDKLCYYDEGLDFPNGNPQPGGNPDWIIEQAAAMYTEMSPETSAFFAFMRQNGLMDLVNKIGKAPGGYCSMLYKYRAPFIFSNFNGTAADIDVLTHEAGHAFQVYSSRDAAVMEYFWPTLEACEIHSMSMEFFAWPWMERFFGSDTDRYKFAHLSGCVLFIPYGVAVDEFQHFVYTNPESGIEERNRAWRAIERRYLPHRDYAGNSFLEQGGFWQKQSHIFTTPFYYIDYALAEICALQFWQRMQQDSAQAWNDYLRLCRAGGSLPFLELLACAGLQSPFAEGCVASLVGDVENWLHTADDGGFAA